MSSQANNELDDTRIFGYFNSWIKVSEKKFFKIDDMYRREVFKKEMKKDFLRTFIIICNMVSQHLNRSDDKLDLIRNIIGSVIGNLIFETCDIEKIKNIIKNLDKTKHIEFIAWINDRRKGAVWVLDTIIDDQIKEIIRTNQGRNKVISDYSEGDKNSEALLNWMTYDDYARFELALSSGASYTDVESMIARGISRTSLCNMFYGFIFIRRLIEGLINENGKMKDQLYLNWYDDNDLFIGDSGAIRFFDGIIILDEIEKEDPWLLKCVSICHNPLDAIESVDSKLDDIGMNKCILFLPMYPSENALKYAVYTFSEKKREIIFLYLQDLYKILNMENDKIALFIKQQRIR